MPDLSTARPLPWRERVAHVVADIHGHDGNPLGWHPRTILRNAIDRLADAGIEAYVGALLDELTKVLRAFVRLEAVETEFGPGQIQANLRYTDALTAADDAARLKYVAKEVAQRYGRTATFMAKPLVGQSGTIEPGSWAPSTVTWSGDNRSAAVRSLVPKPESSRLEVRTASAEANPYWLIAAILSAAAAGLDAAETPPDRVSGSAYLVGDPLPADLPAAIAAARDHTELANLLGPVNVKDFARFAETEWRAYRRMSLTSNCSATAHVLAVRARRPRDTPPCWHFRASPGRLGWVSRSSMVVSASTAGPPGSSLRPLLCSSRRAILRDWLSNKALRR